MADTKDNLLILDLDETLIHASDCSLSTPADFTIGRFHIYHRPHLRQFLAACFDWFEVAFWTSSSEAYATAVATAILPATQKLAFFWSRNRCTAAYDPDLMEQYWKKNLTKVRRRGYRLEKVIVVDDSPEKWTGSYGNLVLVKPFTGETEEDDELLFLLSYLEVLRKEDNIRKVDKRNWKSSSVRMREQYPSISKPSRGPARSV